MKIKKDSYAILENDAELTLETLSRILSRYIDFSLKIKLISHLGVELGVETENNLLLQNMHFYDY
jgi:hypothetical protein